MNNTDKIGVAIIGTGFGQKVHLPAFQEHPRTQVVAIYNPNLEKAKTIAGTHHIPHACQSVEEIVALPDVQAVSITTPPFLHFEMAKTAINAGKHLLLEKPTVLSVKEALKLYQMAQQNHVCAAMDFEFRFVPAWQHFAELLSQNYVGQKRLIKIDWLVSSRADASRPWNWYAQKDKGGGALGAIGSHSFDYIHWLFGPVRRLCAQLSTAVALRPDPTENNTLKLVDADDSCTLMLELADGTPCQVCLSSCTYQGRGHWVEVYGEQGTLVLGSDNKQDYIHGFRLWGSQAGQPLAEIKIPEQLEFPRIFPDGRIAPIVRVIDQWVEAIDAKKEPVSGLREGVYSQLLMDLTHESHATGTWVKVPDFGTFLKNNS
jgi:predicted dehydrogenase